MHRLDLHADWLFVLWFGPLLCLERCLWCCRWRREVMPGDDQSDCSNRQQQGEADTPCPMKRPWCNGVDGGGKYVVGIGEVMPGGVQ